MNKKRHTAHEIGVKLHQAEEMAREGKLQSEIARALGISVMTYHRWRKLRQSRPAMPEVTLADLELENSRLRRLLPDLMLEKVKLEAELSARRDRASFRVASVSELKSHSIVKKGM
jgi:putative transposase